MTIVWHIRMHNTHSHVHHMLHTIHQSDDDDTLSHHTLSHAQDLFHVTVCIFECVYVLSFCTTLLVFPCIVAEAFLITTLLCAGWFPISYMTPSSHMYISMCSYMQRPIGLDDCTCIVCSQDWSFICASDPHRVGPLYSQLQLYLTQQAYLFLCNHMIFL